MMEFGTSFTHLRSTVTNSGIRTAGINWQHTLVASLHLQSHKPDLYHLSTLHPSLRSRNLSHRTRPRLAEIDGLDSRGRRATEDCDSPAPHSSNAHNNPTDNPQWWTCRCGRVQGLPPEHPAEVPVQRRALGTRWMVVTGDFPSTAWLMLLRDPW